MIKKTFEHKVKAKSLSVEGESKAAAGKVISYIFQGVLLRSVRTWLGLRIYVLLFLNGMITYRISDW